jgi:hypothetical protein
VAGPKVRPQARSGAEGGVGSENGGETQTVDEIPNGKERRLVHRLLHHWRNAQSNGQLPTLDSVYGQGLGDSHRHLIVLDVNGDEPMFRFIGPFFAEQAAEQCIGQTVSAAPQNTLVVRAVRHYRTVLQRQAPMTFSEEFYDRFDRYIRYRSVILPISNDGTTITHLLCAASTIDWRPTTANKREPGGEIDAGQLIGAEA